MWERPSPKAPRLPRCTIRRKTINASQFWPTFDKNMKKNTIKSLYVQNLLSFGMESPRVDFSNLNVLIGPNGSGKSNLIEVIGLLRSTPKDFAGEVGDSGGISELLWKGKPRAVTATIEVKLIERQNPGSLIAIAEYMAAGYGEE